MQTCFEGPSPCSHHVPSQALQYVIYDNACAVVRMLRKRGGACWNILKQLKWVIDRLHFKSHTACKDASSSWYVPDVNPNQYHQLQGVDTEAAEQIFSLASRWQAGFSCVWVLCGILPRLSLLYFPSSPSGRLCVLLCRLCSATRTLFIKNSFC